MSRVKLVEYPGLTMTWEELKLRWISLEAEAKATNGVIVERTIKKTSETLLSVRLDMRPS